MIKTSLEKKLTDTMGSLEKSRESINQKNLVYSTAYDAGVVTFTKLLAFSADPFEKTEFLFQFPDQYVKKFDVQDYSIRKNRALKRLADAINEDFVQYRNTLKDWLLHENNNALLNVLGADKKRPTDDEVNSKIRSRAEKIVDYLLVMREIVASGSDIDDAKKSVSTFDSAIRDVTSVYMKTGQSIRAVNQVMKIYEDKIKQQNAKWYVSSTNKSR